MQTFLPYSDFSLSLRCLDYRRLGKQRVEAMQLLNVLEGRQSAWSNHPAAKMWRGYEEALKLYHNLAIQIWIERGYKNSMVLRQYSKKIIYPNWCGMNSFHAAHRSNLLRKDPKFYSQYGWKESADLPYIWPV